MRAVVQDVYGPYREVLRVRDIPQPIAGTGQVLVRVRATSVHADVWHAVSGLPYVPSAPLHLPGDVHEIPRSWVRFAPQLPHAHQP